MDPSTLRLVYTYIGEKFYLIHRLLSFFSQVKETEGLLELKWKRKPAFGQSKVLRLETELI